MKIIRLCIISFTINIYLPIYHEYVNSCVIGINNGTFLNNNIYSIAYNYASSNGNEKITTVNFIFIILLIFIREWKIIAQLIQKCAQVILHHHKNNKI